MSDVSGTIRKLDLDGTSFDVMADTNISEVGGPFENENIPTSGRNMRKMTRRPENREDVVVAANGAERQQLRDFSQRIDNFPMSYTTAAGDVYHAEGGIEFENRETEENRASLILLPAGEWEPFLA